MQADVNDYQMRWVRRTRKDRPPGNADETDRAKFAKLRNHLIRVDDELTCKTCGKRFEIPSMHSLVFVDQIEGLPKMDDEDDDRTRGSGLGAGPALIQPRHHPPPHLPPVRLVRRPRGSGKATLLPRYGDDEVGRGDHGPARGGRRSSSACRHTISAHPR